MGEMIQLVMATGCIAIKEKIFFADCCGVQESIWASMLLVYEQKTYPFDPSKFQARTISGRLAAPRGLAADNVAVPLLLTFLLVLVVMEMIVVSFQLLVVTVMVSGSCSTSVPEKRRSSWLGDPNI